MRLSDVFNGSQLHNTVNQTAGNQSEQGSVQSASVSRQIQALTPGQTLQGEVISREGNQVQIRVADDLVLEAKVDQSINLEVGKTMTFQVRGNGQTLQLSPLFANTATQANALKALEMAALPVNQNTMEMTGLMMDAGLSIDKNSLQQMFREINLFSNASTSDVVDLHKLGLPVNEENLAQVSSYKNLTHQLVEGMHTIQSGLSDTVNSMVSEGNSVGAARMFQDLLSLVGGLQDGLGDTQNTALTGGQSMDVNAQSFNGQGYVSAEAAKVFIDEGVLQQESALAEEGVAQDGHALSKEGVSLQDRLSEALANAAKQINDAGRAEVLELTDGLSGQASGNTEAYTSFQNVVNTLLRAEQDGPHAQLLTQLSRALESGDATGQMRALEQLLGKALQEGNNSLLAKLVGNKGAQNLLTEGLAKLWTIEPKDVADAGKVEDLYRRLDTQLKELTQILEQNGQEQSAAFKAVSNMAQNVDFLQQLNQAYTYVQLPLRLQTGDAHGDLYVYTNKRNLSAKDGQISALLHLDMEHLGPVDVYVAMQADHVNTRFYVQDDEMLDFLEQHMDILTKRLQNRGYNCDFAMQVRDGDSKESGLQGLLAKEEGVPIAQYAFDVRA